MPPRSRTLAQNNVAGVAWIVALPYLWIVSLAHWVNNRLTARALNRLKHFLEANALSPEEAMKLPPSRGLWNWRLRGGRQRR